jgi:hypothetical protein
LTDTERQRLLGLLYREASERLGADEVLINIIAKLTGTDTALIARRAYPAPQVEVEKQTDAGG